MLDVKKTITNVLKKITLNYVDATLESPQTITVANTDVTLKINTLVSSNGNKLTLDTTNYSIIVGSGVSHVDVRGRIYITTSSNNNVKFLRIYQNNEIVAQHVIQGQPYNSYEVYGILPVTQGDVFTLTFQSQGGTVEIYNLGRNTSLTVKAIG